MHDPDTVALLLARHACVGGVAAEARMAGWKPRHRRHDHGFVLSALEHLPQLRLDEYTVAGLRSVGIERAEGQYPHFAVPSFSGTTARAPISRAKSPPTRAALSPQVSRRNTMVCCAAAPIRRRSASSRPSRSMARPRPAGSRGSKS